MPFYAHKEDELLRQIEMLIQGHRVPVIEIGYLTDEQHKQINDSRIAHGYPTLESPEILYMGKHHINSRHRKDGYTAQDILVQIKHILDVDVDIPATRNQTKLVSKVVRIDAYKNKITDIGVLELMSRKPKAELFSVIPKGDVNKPNNIQKQKKVS